MAWDAKGKEEGEKTVSEVVLNISQLKVKNDEVRKRYFCKKFHVLSYYHFSLVLISIGRDVKNDAPKEQTYN